MTRFVGSDADHRFANGPIVRARTLMSRYERAPSLTDAAFYGIFERELHERAGRWRVAFHPRDRDAMPARDRAHAARMPCFITGTARRRAQQAAWRAVRTELAPQRSKRVDARSFEPGGIGQIARKSAARHALGAPEPRWAPTLARKLLVDAEHAVGILANAGQELAEIVADRLALSGVERSTVGQARIDRLKRGARGVVAVVRTRRLATE